MNRQWFRIRAAIAAAVMLFAGMAPRSAQSDDLTDASLGNAPFNQYRFIGTHNAYHLEPDPAVKIWLGRTGRTADADFLRAVTYTHLPLTTQLALGVRQFEIDLYNDPEGGRFARPALAELISASGQQLEAPVDPTGELKSPGLKVLHVPDIDWRSTCPTFRSCLRELKSWSDLHSNHFPIMIVLDLKSEGANIDIGASLTSIIPFGNREIMSVETEILSVLPRQDIYTPDELRDGHENIRDRILKRGWPSLNALRGKFVFILSNSALVDSYRGKNINLVGRLLFADLEPGDPSAAFIERLDPRDPSIHKLQQQGYIVQTFADFQTKASRKSDFKGLNAALESGASSIATDYILDDRRFSTYCVRFGERAYPS